jgi:hypothetical protein
MGVTENSTKIVTYALLQASQYVLEYLLRFLAQLHPLSRETQLNLMKRFVASLTQQGVPIQGILKPSGMQHYYQGHRFLSVGCCIKIFCKI